MPEVIIYNKSPDIDPVILPLPDQSFYRTVYLDSNHQDFYKQLFRIYERIGSYLPEYRWIEAERYFMESPEYAYRYAMRGEQRWPEAEQTIIKDPVYALRYAMDMLRSRWPEAESSIAKDPSTAWPYVINILRRRWPEAEPAIAKEGHAAVQYAIGYLKRRFIEAEPIILSDASLDSLMQYAIHCVHGRWPEAEKVILKWPTTPNYINDKYVYQLIQYSRLVIKGRWPEAEKIILNSEHSIPKYAIQYSFYILRGRWPELELKFLSDNETKKNLIDEYVQIHEKRVKTLLKAKKFIREFSTIKEDYYKLCKRLGRKPKEFKIDEDSQSVGGDDFEN